MTDKRRLIRYLPTLVGVTVVGAVSVGLVVLISGFLDGEPSNKKLVQQISLIAPPPPPPPPPKIEKPPEPEVEEVKLEEPDPVPDEVPDAPSDEPPAGDLLGLDADGTGGADGFGLVGRKGGRSLLGGGDRFAFYGNAVTQLIQEFLYERNDIRSKKYSVKVKLWLAPTGKIERVELMNSTGDRSVDESLQVALMELGEISEKPPEDLPQPVRVRITSRL